MYPSLRAASVRTIHELSWRIGLSSRLARRRHGGRVLLLHEVGAAGYPTARFREHLVYLRERYQVVSLDHVLAAADSSDGDVNGMVALTFDDGLRSNVLAALPLLREFGLPATFFVCPTLIENGRWLWNHDCANVSDRWQRRIGQHYCWTSGDRDHLPISLWNG